MCQKYQQHAEIPRKRWKLKSSRVHTAEHSNLLVCFIAFLKGTRNACDVIETTTFYSTNKLYKRTFTSTRTRLFGMKITFTLNRRRIKIYIRQKYASSQTLRVYTRCPEKYVRFTLKYQPKTLMWMTSSFVFGIFLSRNKLPYIDYFSDYFGCSDVTNSWRWDEEMCGDVILGTSRTSQHITDGLHKYEIYDGIFRQEWSLCWISIGNKMIGPAKWRQKNIIHIAFKFTQFYCFYISKSTFHPRPLKIDVWFSNFH